MVADDACSLVKDDLEKGSYTRYTDNFPIYIDKKDVFQGGNVYVLLKFPIRNPMQDFTGKVIYTEGGCTIVVVCNTDTIRDKLYLDIIDILNATNRGYELEHGTDNMNHQNQVGHSLEVALFL